MIIKLAASFFMSLILTAIIGSFLVPILRRIKAGQSIREDGPKWHMSKQGTPTMGGLMFIVSIGLATFIVGFPAIRAGDMRHVFVFIFAIVYAVIGFLDDYEKLKKKQNMGLTAKQKFLLQLGCGYP